MRAAHTGHNVTPTTALIAAAHTQTHALMQSLIVTDSKNRIKRRQTVDTETEQLTVSPNRLNFLAIHANVSQEQTVFSIGDHLKSLSA